MKYSPFSYLFILLLTGISSCQPTTQTLETFQGDDAQLRYSGRVDLSNPAEPVLVGAASSVEMSFLGDSAQLLLQKLNPGGEHNYVSLELDGKYLGRIKLEKDSMETITARVPKGPFKGPHRLKVYKETEAANGYVLFGGVNATELVSLPAAPARRIEFIGNSITCGMGMEYAQVPCDSGVWYDQHNAYLAYGPQVAKELNADFMLSCVSGIGMYRNWNSLEPVMPDVYENTHLNVQDSLPWNFSTYQPELVSIALGTNDFSEGDGVQERLPFDSAQYVNAYIDFVNTIYSKYPNTQLVLLTSPMVSGEKGKLFASCLQAVKSHCNRERQGKKPIAVFDFESFVPHGCGYHPDIKDHAKMAQMLIPFYKEVMGW